MHARVLLMGKDAQLLDSRSLLLAHAGFDTAQATSADTIPVAAARDVAVAVLCHTLNAAEKREAITSVKASSRRAMIVHILKDHSTDELPEHASFRVFDGPQQLIAAVRDLVERWESGML